MEKLNWFLLQPATLRSTNKSLTKPRTSRNPPNSLIFKNIKMEFSIVKMALPSLITIIPKTDRSIADRYFKLPLNKIL